MLRLPPHQGYRSNRASGVNVMARHQTLVSKQICPRRRLLGDVSPCSTPPHRKAQRSDPMPLPLTSSEVPCGPRRRPQDVFNDSRTILEPAGAVALAGAKAYLHRYGVKVRGAAGGARKGRGGGGRGGGWSRSIRPPVPWAMPGACGARREKAGVSIPMHVCTHALLCPPAVLLVLPPRTAWQTCFQ